MFYPLLFLPLLKSQAAPVLPKVSLRDIGALSEQHLLGFARIPGKGRVALLDTGEYVAYERGRLVRYPLSIPRTVSAYAYDIGDTDGDGIDEIVGFNETRCTVTTFAWEQGAFVRRDTLSLAPSNGYQNPIIVPGGDNHPEWLLLTRYDSTDKGYLPGTLVAFRRRNEQWERVWRKPLFGTTGLSQNPTQVFWEAGFDGKAVLNTSDGTLGDTRGVVCIALSSIGFTPLWRTTEHLGAKVDPVRSVSRTAGAGSRCVVSSAFHTLNTTISRQELLEFTDTGEVARAELPANTSAIWEPRPGVRLVLGGNRVSLVSRTGVR